MEGLAFLLVVFVLLVVLVAVKIGCIGAALWMRYTAPDLALRAADLYAQRPGRCVLVGLPNLLIVGFLTLVLLNAGPLKFFGLIFFLGLIALAVLAYSPAYHLTARRLLDDDGAITTTQLLKGAVAAEAVYLAPVLGQALSLAALVRGSGAVILSVFPHREALATEPTEPAPPQA